MSKVALILASCIFGGLRGQEWKTGKQTSETVDLDRLDEWLSSDDSPQDCMFLSDLDAFMHGIVCGPVMVSVEEWLPIALGGDPFDVPSWVLTDIATLHMEMVERLMSDDPHIEPLFWQAREGHVVAMDWCEGFTNAVKLRAKEWLRLTESGEHDIVNDPYSCSHTRRQRKLTLRDTTRRTGSGIR